MKILTNSALRLAASLALVTTALAVSAAAQGGRDLRVISAKAGGVNLVTGGAEFRRANETVWMSLSTKDDLRGGDVVKTSTDGRVELLLNPGSYWRAGADTEFELAGASPGDLRLRLARGAAVVEATGFGDFDVAVNVVTPQTRVRIARAGVYRLSVLPEGETVLVVEKGRAYVGEGEGQRVKGGKVVRIGRSGAVEVAKFDKKTRDDLDLWSRNRGRELAKANEKLSLRHANAMLANLDWNRYFSAASPGYGFWFWNTSYGCYTFMPFYSRWRSPYGFGYGSWFYSPYNAGCYSCPSRGVYARPQIYAGGGGGVTNTSGGSNPTGTTGGSAPAGMTPSPQPMPQPTRDVPMDSPRSYPRGGSKVSPIDQ